MFCRYSPSFFARNLLQLYKWYDSCTQIFSTYTLLPSKACLFLSSQIQHTSVLRTGLNRMVGPEKTGTDYLSSSGISNILFSFWPVFYEPAAKKLELEASLVQFPKYWNNKHVGSIEGPSFWECVGHPCWCHGKMAMPRTVWNYS